MIDLNKLLFGVVESTDDPLCLGRCAVRYIRIHTDNLSKLPTASLPWSDVMGTINSASISGVGTAPVGIVPGTMVAAIPIDDGYQQFLIIGTLAGNRTTYINSSYGFNDPSSNYPISGVVSDVNVLAGGIASSTSTSNGSVVESPNAAQSGNVIQPATIPGSSDPTIPVSPSGIADTTTPWMPIAIGQIGITQLANPTVVQQYLNIGGGITTGGIVAWCSSFCGWCLSQVGIKGTRSASDPGGHPPRIDAGGCLSSPSPIGWSHGASPSWRYRARITGARLPV